MRSQRDGVELALVPHWGHYVGGAFLFVVTTAFVGLLVFARHQPGQSYGIVYALVALQLLGATAWVTYPLWGGERVSFENGFFRVLGRRAKSASLEVPVVDLRAFEAESTNEGYKVIAVKTDRERLPLSLEFGNPLYGNSKKAPRREDYREEAVEIAKALSEMLIEARRGHGTYR